MSIFDLFKSTKGSDDDDLGGIDPERGHPRALELIPDEFFWDCTDELGPFGSDEGDTALEEWRDWRRDHPDKPLIDCLHWTIREVGEMDPADYTPALAEPGTVEAMMDDPDIDDDHFIYTLDASVIATGFGQLADEGTIEADAKPLIATALQRQIAYAQLSTDWSHADAYQRNLRRLQEVLERA